MLRAVILATLILSTGCGSGANPAPRADSVSIPVPGPIPNRPKIMLAYEVKRQAGESLKAISRRFHAPLPIVERFNPRIGQGRRPSIIYIPISEATAWKEAVPGRPPAPIVKLTKDLFLRPVKLGPWSPLELGQAQSLDEWFIPTESQRLSFPAEGSISSGFSWRRNRFHKGLDIAARRGTPIFVAQDGKVTFRGWRRGFGLLVIVQHKQGRTYYAHCQSSRVKKGQLVARGDLIARVGATGQSRGPHLHFEFRDDHNQPVDPTPFLMPPCSRPVALASRSGRPRSGRPSWSAKPAPCRSTDM